MGGHASFELEHQLACCGHGAVFWCNSWVGYVLVLVKNGCWNSCCSCVPYPHFTWAVMSKRCTEYTTFYAMLCKGSPLLWLVMHQHLHSNWHKWSRVVTVRPVYLGICSTLGLLWYSLRSKSCRSAWGISLYHRWTGKVAAVPLMTPLKWSFHVWIDFSAKLR